MLSLGSTFHRKLDRKSLSFPAFSLSGGLGLTRTTRRDGERTKKIFFWE